MFYFDESTISRVRNRTEECKRSQMSSLVPMLSREIVIL